MSILDKFLDAIRLNDDFDDDDDFFDEEELEAMDEEKPKHRFFKKLDDDFDEEEEEEYVKPSSKKAKEPEKVVKQPTKQTSKQPTSSKITPMRNRKSGNSSNNMEVCVIKPSSMEDTREIADTLVDNSTVILNLEGIDVELAQRIIDFTSGACYSLGGSLQKVSSYIFVLGPYNVDITGDLQNILGGSAPSVRAGY